MVQYKVITVAQALDQLQRIIQYIKENDSVSNAKIVHDGIIEAIESLQTMPHYHHTVYYPPMWNRETYLVIEYNPYSSEVINYPDYD